MPFNYWINLVPRALFSWPAVRKRELWEHPFWIIKGNNWILHIRSHCAVRSLHLLYLRRMPEMDAPGALVFRPLVKGNEALVTRLLLNGYCLDECSSSTRTPRYLGKPSTSSPGSFTHDQTKHVQNDGWMRRRREWPIEPKLGLLWGHCLFEVWADEEPIQRQLSTMGRKHNT